MSTIDGFARGLVGVVALFAGIVVGGLDLLEDLLRFLLTDVGLSSDVQTMILLFIELTFLVIVMRLLRRGFRQVFAILMLVLLVHTLSRIARVPWGI